MGVASGSPVRITLLPPLAASEAVALALAKLAWYLAPYSDRPFHIVAFWQEPPVPAAALPFSPALAACLDRGAAATLASIAGRIENVALPAADLPERLAATEILYVWDAVAAQAFLKSHGLRIGRFARPATLLADPRFNRFQSFTVPHLLWQWFGTPDPEGTAQALRCLTAEARSRAGSDRCFVVGGGESVLSATDLDAAHGLAVVCNAVIQCESLIERLQPIAITLMDPFLAGPSRYGEAYRRVLGGFLARHRPWLVTFDLYRPLYQSWFGDSLDGRVIGLGFENRGFPPDRFQIDLARTGRVVDARNVVTSLAIPLACTLADEICLVGLDGIDPSTPNLYRSLCIPDVGDSRLVVSGDLPGNSDPDYQQRHSDSLNALIAWAERAGKRFVVTTPSHYPSLQTRYRAWSGQGAP